ncbi:hypothetical protein GcC1_052039, partial [Golovinomyces cichoracearum]
VGIYDGGKPASRWLAGLAYERKLVGGENTPEDFFEAIEILFEGEAALWLDSSSRLRRMVDFREKATEEDINQFKIAFQSQFPAKVEDTQQGGNLPAEIGSLEQKRDENLTSYYERAKELLRRSYGYDIPIDGNLPMSPIEMVVLNNIVAAFVGGISDDQVRSAVLMESTSGSGSLLGTYEKVENVKARLERLAEVKKTREEKREFELLKNHYVKQWGRPLSSVLAEIEKKEEESDFRPSRIIAPTALAQFQNTANPVNRPVQNQHSIVNDARNKQVQFHNAPSTQRNHPPRHLSRHSLVNGSQVYNQENGFLCIRCGKIGHKRPDCSDVPLEWWGQNYLRELAMPSLQANFVEFLGMEQDSGTEMSQTAIGEINVEAKIVHVLTKKEDMKKQTAKNLLKR